MTSKEKLLLFLLASVDFLVMQVVSICIGCGTLSRFLTPASMLAYEFKLKQRKSRKLALRQMYCFHPKNKSLFQNSNAKDALIDSMYGHDGFLIEFDTILRQLRGGIFKGFKIYKSTQFQKC